MSSGQRRSWLLDWATSRWNPSLPLSKEIDPSSRIKTAEAMIRRKSANTDAGGYIKKDSKGTEKKVTVVYQVPSSNATPAKQEREEARYPTRLSTRSNNTLGILRLRRYQYRLRTGQQAIHKAYGNI